MQRAHAAAAPDFGAGCGGDLENHFVQYAAGDAEGGKRQRGGRHFTARVEPDGGNANGAECREIDAEVAEIECRLAADELAADFVVRTGFAFDQDHVAPRPGELRGRGAAGNAAADHQRLRVRVHQSLSRETQSR